MAAVAQWGALMPKRWLQPREKSSPKRWAVGCHDCQEETSFIGEESLALAVVWYRDHYCPEEPKDDLPYLTLPRLDMNVEELARWANPNASVSANWVREHLGKDHRAKGAHQPT